MLEAIGHIALVVQNPERTASLFKELFAAKSVSRKDSDGHEETFVKLGRTWFALVQADVQRSRTGEHIAFSVSKRALMACAEKLKQTGQEFFLPGQIPLFTSTTMTAMSSSWTLRTWKKISSTKSNYSLERTASAQVRWHHAHVWPRPPSSALGIK